MNKERKIDLSALSDKQREAVLSAHPRLLVLAGAGSGKTKTLLQKILFLIEEEGVSPSAILAITFTRNAANEMVDRLLLSADRSGAYQEILGDKKLPAEAKAKARWEFTRRYKWIERLTLKTFHGFCYGVLRERGVREFDNRFRLIGEEKGPPEEGNWGSFAPETVMEVLRKLTAELCEDDDYLLDLKRYVLDYLVERAPRVRPRASNPHPEGLFYSTLSGERVRSKSEQWIADWLYRHRIPYEYEPALNVKDYEFRPDFHIPAAGLYLEHVSDKSKGMDRKVEQCERGALLLVKTFEHQAADSAEFGRVLAGLFRNRLPGHFERDRRLDFREEFNGYQEELADFLKLVMRVTDMVKVEASDFEPYLQRGEADPHERVRSFYRLARPLLARYLAYCVDKSYLDFNDLISRTISLFENRPEVLAEYRERYRHLLVDEFQDVNDLQVKLISLLLRPETRLFCVGDDWQSIYGFRGSNVKHIVEFERAFPEAATVKLDLNYRSSESIVEAGNEVIKHNKYRIEKEVRASKRSEQKIVVYDGASEEENVEFCLSRLRELREAGYPREEILFLYRRKKMFEPFRRRFFEEGLLPPSRTIHAAKGLEAGVVFIVGLTEGKGGFPDIWLDDRIFQVVRPTAQDELLEEERRLFYVALTRAKDKLFLITEKGNESSFIREIPTPYTVRSGEALAPVVEKVLLCRSCSSRLENLWRVCPYCGTGCGRQ